MKTVKQLAAELKISKSTLHRLIQRNGFETIQDGNRRLIDETIEQAIISALKDKSIHNETIQNDSETIQNDSDSMQKRFRNDSKQGETIQGNELRTAPDPVELLQSQLELLKSQLEDLKADKAYLQERLTAAEQERDSLTKERQTILAELLELRKPKVIEVKEAAAPAPDPTRQKERRSRSEQRSPAPAPVRSGTQKRQGNKFQSIIQGIKNRLK